jgi:hypothetical protein
VLLVLLIGFLGLSLKKHALFHSGWLVQVVVELLVHPELLRVTDQVVQVVLQGPVLQLFIQHELYRKQYTSI